MNIKPPVDPDNPTHYVNKEEMRQALIEHRAACLKAESEGKELPGVSNYLGDCFIKIAKGLAMKYNFRDYSYVNDMVMDGVYTCLKYVRSFDPDKISKITNKPVSAFSYFTQVCFYSFVNRIKTETKEADIKWALVLETDLESFSQGEEGEEFKVNMAEFMNSLGPRRIQERKEKKAKEKPIDPMEEFT